LGIDIGTGLNVFHAGEHLPLSDVVALLDQEVGNATEGSGAYVDVSFRFDLPGAADDGGKVLANHFAGEHLGIAGLRLVDHGENSAAGQQNHESDDEDFFHIRRLVRKSPLSVYAKDG
jgi:hypothetical protein